MKISEILQDQKKLKAHLWKVFGLCFIFADLAYFFVDQSLAFVSSAKESPRFWLFNREITNVGWGTHYFVLSVLIYICARWLVPGWLVKHWPHLKQSRINWPWLQQWSFLFFLSLIGTGLSAQIIKFIFGRQRPHVSEDFSSHIFKPLNWQATSSDFQSGHWQSFPSGHSQTLFTVFVFFTMLFPKARGFLLVLISYLVMTRAFTQAHFTSDVIMGACLGYCGSLLILKFFQAKYPDFLTGGPLKNSKIQS